jgi:hypothetical protein
MGWLDKLQEVAAGPAEARDAAAAAPEVHHVIVSVRPSNGWNDPGEAARGYFTLQGGLLTMTNEKGEPSGAAIPIKPNEDPQAIARAEISRRWSENDWFDRRLEYRRIGVA